MFLSMNWIRDFVDLDGVDIPELIQKFTLGTAEVEGTCEVGKEVQKVVVGQILSVSGIPESEKLHLLKVDAGGEVLQIMCGAKNVREGIKVPVALAGGRVGDLLIEKRPLAGYDSEGMCCSEKEIGISDDHEGLWILPEDAPVGTDIKKLYEIEDTIFEVDNKSLTNRPDLWGHYGIAREMAALLGRELKAPKMAELSAYDSLPEVPIRIENPELCLRYSGMAFENVTEKVSPVNMRIRLYRCGMRGINLLTDLTNYLMLELGQPMHAFDYSKVSEIDVRCMEEPIVFSTLDGKERKVQPEALMITSKGKPVAVAGVMGGLESEIEEDTTSFLLESANFNAVSVRRTSQALGLRTDASMRYEKTLDPELTVQAIGRYLCLLQTIDPGVRVISRLTDAYPAPYPKREVTFDKAYVDRMTGIDIGTDRMIKTLRSLGFLVTVNAEETENPVFTVEVPSFRATKDVTMKADLIEEITRIYGYDNFEIKTAEVALSPRLFTPAHRLERRVKDLLSQSFGAHEVHSYLWNDGRRLAELGLENEGLLRLTNSVSPDIDTIRKEVGTSLLCFALKNRGYGMNYRMFEIGSCVPSLQEDGLAREEKHLAVLLYGRRGEEMTLMRTGKQIAETLSKSLLAATFSYGKKETAASYAHPFNTFSIGFEGEEIGHLSLLLPQVAERIEKKAAAVLLELSLSFLEGKEGAVKRFEEPSRFPEITSDISFIVSQDLPYSAFEGVLEKVEDPLLKKSELVGIYEDASLLGKKSVTLRFTFGSAERTLEAEEVQASCDRLREAMKSVGAVTLLA